MHKRIVISTICLIAASLVASIPATAASNEHDRWQERPDFLTLRKEVAAGEHYAEQCLQQRPNQQLADLIKKQRFDRAAKIGNEWLVHCPIDIRVHYLTAMALDRSGEHESAALHFAWSNGLAKSVISSGDGKSANSAYQTVSEKEQYDILYLFGLKITQQSIVSGAFPTNQVSAINDKGQEYDLFFAPSSHYAGLERQLNAVTSAQ